MFARYHRPHQDGQYHLHVRYRFLSFNTTQIYSKHVWQQIMCWIINKNAQKMWFPCPRPTIFAYVVHVCPATACGPCRLAQIPHRILPICCTYVRGQICNSAMCKKPPGSASLVDVAKLTKNGFDQNRPLWQMAWVFFHHEMFFFVHTLCRTKFWIAH